MSFKTGSATYTITPMYYGRFSTYEKSVLQFLTDPGVKVDSPSLGFLVRGNGKNIVVDTGPGTEEEMNRLHPGLGLDIPKEVNVVETLAAEGLKPEDIDYVILSHLHYDHCHNGDKFPGKIFYVQKAELMYAIDPLDIHAGIYESPKVGMTPPWLKIFTQIHLVEGDLEIDDGIKLIFTPGHSPGGQSVLINTTDGPYLLVGDVVMQYENWEGRGAQKRLFSSAHVNLIDFDNSLKKVEALNAYMLPPHDYKVLENKMYPAKKRI